MKNNIISVKQLRNNMEGYIRDIEKGGTLLVVKKSKPVFKISSPENEDAWEPVIDFTKIRKGGVPINDLLSRL